MIHRIPVVSSPTEAMEEQVVAMDGALQEALSEVVLAEGAHIVRCIGVIAAVGAETAFHQTMSDSIELTDMASLEALRGRDVDLVVIGPTALLGLDEESVTGRIMETLPGVRILCLTGIRTDLSGNGARSADASPGYDPQAVREARASLNPVLDVIAGGTRTQRDLEESSDVQFLLSDAVGDHTRARIARLALKHGVQSVRRGFESVEYRLVEGIERKLGIVGNGLMGERISALEAASA